MGTVEKSPESLPTQPARLLPCECRYFKDLETPEDLDQAIQLTRKRLGVRARLEQRRIEEDLKLQYHFGGKDVAYLPTNEGRVLIAAGVMGSEAFIKALERLNPQEWRQLIFCTPRPWAASASVLLRTSCIR